MDWFNGFGLQFSVCRFLFAGPLGAHLEISYYQYHYKLSSRIIWNSLLMFIVMLLFSFFSLAVVFSFSLNFSSAAIFEFNKTLVGPVIAGKFVYSSMAPWTTFRRPSNAPQSSFRIIECFLMTYSHFSRAWGLESSTRHMVRALWLEQLIEHCSKHSKHHLSLRSKQTSFVPPSHSPR